MAFAKGMTPEELETDPHLHMFRLAKECGCKFIFGSDSHDNQEHDYYGNADIIANMLELTENDLAEICR